MENKPTLAELLAEAHELQRTAEELIEQSLKIREQIQTARESQRKTKAMNHSAA